MKTFSYVTIIGISVSAFVYFFISFKIFRNTTRLSDHLPIAGEGREARVATSKEFSSATVATTISLATVVLVFSELASYMGTWLYWTAITTATGIWVVRKSSSVIWRRLAEKREWRPTLHEFLGASYSSPLLSKGAAMCTCLGFIGALAVELTVGSRFFSALVPAVPFWVALLIIAGIGVGYTMLGGFRAVIVTDRIQMAAIWGAVVALGMLVLIRVHDVGGVGNLVKALPPSVYNFSSRDGLLSFLIGIAVINIPTFLADMSIWQRIAASKDESTVSEGLGGSVIGAIFSWMAFATIACLIVGIVPIKEGENPLLTFIKVIGTNFNFVGSIGLVVGITGLYAASLSTASTQLIAASHAIHTDILGIRNKMEKKSFTESRSELIMSRIIIGLSSVVSIAVVEGLQFLGFTIADLVFAVYGAQLGMVPVVVVALISKSTQLHQLNQIATYSVFLGFFGGWGAAILGKVLSNSDLVFLAPAISLIISTMIMGVGYLSLKRIEEKVSA